MSKDNLSEAYWCDLGDGMKVKVIGATIPSASKYDCPIMDWEGIEENGVSVPYSKETAFRLLEKYRDLSDLISDAIWIEMLKNTTNK